jgi:hypothetical protein
MPRKPKSVTSEAPLAPIPAEILEQFVLDLPRGRAGTLGRPPWTSSQFSTGIASRRQPRRMTRSGREWDGRHRLPEGHNPDRLYRRRKNERHEVNHVSHTKILILPQAHYSPRSAASRS